MTLARRMSAEALGSMLLAAAVIGSGIMAERLAGGNAAIALLANTGATVAALAVLIALLAPVSGAHLNPVVTLAMRISGRLSTAEAIGYSIVQVIGCCAGAMLAHAMFALPLLQVATQARTGVAQWLAELVATAGLVIVVLGLRRAQDASWMVACWIGAAYWFTSSTSFANPAISLARSLTDSFAGVRPVDVPAFIAAQVLGALAALLVVRLLFPRPVAESAPQESAGPRLSPRVEAAADSRD